MIDLHLLAYLDPGTGSLILQGIIAGIFAVLFVLKTCWHSIKNYTLALFGRAPAAEESSDDAHGEAPHDEEHDDDDKNTGIVS